MKRLLTILLVFITVSSYSQTLNTIKVQGVDTAAMLLPYKRNYPRQAVSLTFTTTGTSGAATGTYSNSTGVFTINVPQYLAPTNGQFTSTGAAVTNVTTTTAAPTMYYTKVNNQIHVSASASVTPSGSGLTEFSLILPSTTALSTGVAIGVGTISDSGNTAIVSCFVYLSNSTTAIVRFFPSNAVISTYIVSFDYTE